MKKKLSCIMLIDDNEDDNYFHEIIIKEMEVTDRIIIAESGLEALKFLKDENNIPDLIFLDINMPKMNGWEFLEEYEKLKNDNKAKIVIIMLTTSLNPADRKKAETIPVVHSFEPKPLTEAILDAILNRYF